MLIDETPWRFAAALGALFGLACCGGSTSQHGDGSSPPTRQSVQSLRFSKLAAGRERYCGLRQSDAALVCVRDGKISEERLGPFLDFELHEDLTSYSELCTIDSAGQLACEQWWPVPSGEFHELALGLFNSCALDRDGKVTCWVPDEMGGSPAPDVAGAVELSVDMDHGCVRFDTIGHVRCFGKPYDERVSDLHFQDISAAGSRACGILHDPTLGTGIGCVDNGGVTLELTGNFSSLDTEVDGAGCATDDAGFIRCWGHLTAPTHDERLRHVSVSSSQICALDADGAAHCFRQ